MSRSATLTPALLTRVERLRETVRATAENRPGVYRMIDRNGAALYVGKSIHVRTRLLSYFRALEGEKARRIIARAERVDWDYVADPFAALLHEWRLIRRLRPPFNREHKKETRYSFIKLTGDDPPRLVVVRTVDDDDATYWGPFGAGARVRTATRVLAGVLGLRDCAASTPMRFAEQGDLFLERGDSDGGRAGGAGGLVPLCVRGELGLCMAPCVGRCGRGEYASAVHEAHAFLDGGSYGPVHRLTGQMEQAAALRRYELAARLRERTDTLHRLCEDLALAGSALARLTFAYPLPHHAGGRTVYLIRRGHVLDAVRVRDGRASAGDRDRLREAARRAWSARARSRRRVSGKAAGELTVVAGWFRRRPEELDRVWPFEDLL